MSKQTADIVIRALLAIVAALRKEYGIPNHGEPVTISLVYGHEDGVQEPP